MNQTGMLATLIALVLAFVGTYFARKRNEKSEQSGAEEFQRLNAIRPIQEQIVKLETESIRSTTEFKNAKEAYDAKWRNKKNDGGGSGSDPVDGGPASTSPTA